MVTSQSTSTTIDRSGSSDVPVGSANTSKLGQANRGSQEARGKTVASECRRVVTGHDSKGNSTVVYDSWVPLLDATGVGSGSRPEYSPVQAVKDALAPWHASYDYYDFEETPVAASAVLPPTSFVACSKSRLPTTPTR
jgi:hypothetical protein